MEIRRLLQSEKAGAMNLVWNVFMESEAPDYEDEGIEAFRYFINSDEAIDRLEIYGAYEEENILGVIATRNQGNHIALFFVDVKHHRRGIGRKLFETVLKYSTSDTITVNSSPFATEIYHRLGFVDTSIEQKKNGIRFTPMKYLKSTYV